jgi:hypothetical protein
VKSSKHGLYPSGDAVKLVPWIVTGYFYGRTKAHRLLSALATDFDDLTVQLINDHDAKSSISNRRSGSPTSANALRYPTWDSLVSE